MPSTSEYNQFRRLVGDFTAQSLSTNYITALLNDTTYELTGDFATPITSFDTLLTQYHNEVIYKAAINYWWNDLSELQEKHSMTLGGGATQNVGEKWDRAWQMIQSLQATYDQIQMLQVDITIGNFSRYSKQTLRRIGGIREEDTHA